MGSSANYKLFDLLDQIPPQEHKRLKRWIQFVAAKKDDPLNELYNFVRHKKNRKIELVRKRFLPKLDSDEGKLRILQFNLTKAIEDFWITDIVLNREHNRNLYLVKALKQRGLDKLFLSFVEKEKQTVNKKVLLENQDFLYLYQLEGEHQEYLVKRNQKKEKRREKELLRAFDKWMVAEKLKMSLVNANLENLYGEMRPSIFLKEILDGLESYPEINQEPIIQLWRNLHLFNIRGTDELFKEVLEFLKKIKMNSENIIYITLLSSWLITLV